VRFDAESQLVLFASPYCPHCPVTHLCRERCTARGCLPEGPPHPNLLHPTKGDFRERIAEVNGFDSDHIQAVDQKTPLVPRYVPRIRIGAGIGGYDLVAAVGISLREVERLAKNVRLHGKSAKELLLAAADEYVAFLRRPLSRLIPPVFPSTAVSHWRGGRGTTLVTQPEEAEAVPCRDVLQLRLPVPRDGRTPAVAGVER
jgi:hypothetical protein